MRTPYSYYAIVLLSNKITTAFDDYYHAQKRCVTVVELSEEIENCIPAPNDFEQKMDSEEIGRII